MSFSIMLCVSEFMEHLFRMLHFYFIIPEHFILDQRISSNNITSWLMIVRTCMLSGNKYTLPL